MLMIVATRYLRVDRDVGHCGVNLKICERRWVSIDTAPLLWLNKCGKVVRNGKLWGVDADSERPFGLKWETRTRVLRVT